MSYYPYELKKRNKDAGNESSVCFVRYKFQIYRSHNMLYRTWYTKGQIAKFVYNFALVIIPTHSPEI